MTKKIALIDAYGFVFRAYHSLPPLNRPDGTPVGAVYGFTSMLIKLLATLDVSHAAAVFDSGSKSFRNQIYPEYKAHRPPCPEDLKPQFPIVREVAEALNIPILEKTGFEADDIIATIARQAAAQGYEVLIISSDKDLMQLIDDRIKMYDAMKGKMITEREVHEKFFVTPNKIIEVLALIGDASDNVKGVKGIGPKTAAELINQFGDIENLLANIAQIKQEKRREMLTVGSEDARLSKILVTLKDDVETGTTVDALALKNLDPAKLIGFLERQGFKSLVARVKKEFEADPSYQPPVIAPAATATAAAKTETPKISFEQIIQTQISADFNYANFEAEIIKNGLAIVDYKLGEEESMVTISTAAAGDETKQIFYFTQKNTPSLIEDSGAGQGEVFFKFLARIFADNSVKKILFSAKEIIKYLRVDELMFEDVELMNYLVNPLSKSDLYEVARNNLDEEIDEKLPDSQIAFYIFRNYALFKLYKIFDTKLFEQKLNFCYNVFEKPLIPILAQMELTGIKTDGLKLQQLSKEFEQNINQLSSDIYKLAGHEFNIASSKQLSQVLFEELQLIPTKKSKKTKNFSTNVSVLTELANSESELASTLASKLIDYRKFSKLKSTYTDALIKLIDKNSRIHTTYSAISTLTGRLSSTNPNLQNLPIKTTDGQKIRSAFIAPSDSVLISADYSQIELRVVAHLASVKNLIAAFNEEKDIHRITASQVFGVKESEVDDRLRDKAKAINFGIIYRISDFGLANQLKISREEAGRYIKSYFATYPEIATFMQDCLVFAREHHYVETISGRRCYIRDINHANFVVRSEAERQAINAPVQGSASDIVKKAMIKIDREFKKRKLSAKILLQIHDELVVEALKSEAEQVEKIIKHEMENALLLKLPLKVDIKMGYN